MNALLRKRLLIHAGLLRMKAARAEDPLKQRQLSLDADALALQVRSSERGVRSPKCGA